MRYFFLILRGNPSQGPKEVRQNPKASPKRARKAGAARSDSAAKRRRGTEDSDSDSDFSEDSSADRCLAHSAGTGPRGHTTSKAGRSLAVASWNPPFVFHSVVMPVSIVPLDSMFLTAPHQYNIFLNIKMAAICPDSLRFQAAPEMGYKKDSESHPFPLNQSSAFHPLAPKSIVAQLTCGHFFEVRIFCFCLRGKTEGREGRGFEFVRLDLARSFPFSLSSPGKEGGVYAIPRRLQ